MIDTFSIYSDLRQSFGDEAAAKMARVIQNLYDELSQTVRREDFNELKAVVKELAEAQKRTEKRLDSLTARVEELAEAQKRTEARVEELAEAQKRTEARVEELAEAQKRTEIKLERLIDEHRKTRKELGGLSHTVGYRLEDEAIWALPGLLKSDFDIAVVGNLRRGYLEIAPGRYLEVNIWGEARKDGKELAVLGEAKSQLKKRDVDGFVKTISRIKDTIKKEIFPVLITYQTSPQVQQAAEKENIKIYFSFELNENRKS